MVKIHPEIGNFKPKCWNRNTMYFRKYAIERRQNLMQSLERKMQFSDAIWWGNYKSMIADCRHIDNRFWLYFGVILADYCEIWIRDEESQCHYRSSDHNWYVCKRNIVPIGYSTWVRWVVSTNIMRSSMNLSTISLWNVTNKATL